MEKTSKEYRKTINDLVKKEADLLVLIDTLQTVLRRAETVLTDNDEYDYVFTQSAKWSMNWKENG